MEEPIPVREENPEQYNQNLTGNPGVIAEYESLLEFESHLINPASEKAHTWLTRDAVLSNITTQQLLEIRIGLELVQILKHLGLKEAQDVFLADINALLVASRGVDGFHTKMMHTNISELKGMKPEDIEKKGFRWLFQKRKQ